MNKYQIKFGIGGISTIYLFQQTEIKMTSKQNQSTTLTQIDKAKQALLEIRENVSTQDRMAACLELNLSSPTVQRYLNGEAKKVEIALMLIKFFRERIQKREKELAA